jgi:N-methylhydantoinase B
VGAIQSVNNVAVNCLSKMLLASDKYAHEATSIWDGSHIVIFLYGLNQRREPAIGILTEAFGGAGGARTFADGVDIGGVLANPISRMANVELTEATFPVRYLFRRRKTDSAGPGRYRGGAGGEYALVPHDAPDGGIHFVVSGKGIRHAMGEGLAGGYVAAPNWHAHIRHAFSTYPANVDAGRFALALEEIGGETIPVSWSAFRLDQDDALYVRWNGGGGFGDPLDRRPEEVRDDVVKGVVSRKAARELYGVVLGPDGEGVDEAATNALRADMRAARALPWAAE